MGSYQLNTWGPEELFGIIQKVGSVARAVCANHNQTPQLDLTVSIYVWKEQEPQDTGHQDKDSSSYDC